MQKLITWLVTIWAVILLCLFGWLIPDDEDEYTLM